MLENQILQFKSQRGDSCEVPIPAPLKADALRLFSPALTQRYDIENAAGSVISYKQLTLSNSAQITQFDLSGLSSQLNEGDCFRLVRKTIASWDRVHDGEVEALRPSSVYYDSDGHASATFAVQIGYGTKKIVFNSIMMNGGQRYEDEYGQFMKFKLEIGGLSSVDSDSYSEDHGCEYIDTIAGYVTLKLHTNLTDVQIENIYGTADITSAWSSNDLPYIQADWDELDPVVSVGYSNALQACSTSNICEVMYRCNEDAFGFPFSNVDGYAKVWLPIYLSKPQFKQEDKTYVKTDGSVVVLFAKHYKEWEAQTEYLPEELHDRIICALSCDELLIDGVRLTKSAQYEIDWSNAIESACGTKKAMATFKLMANVSSRNSNC